MHQAIQNISCQFSWFSWKWHESRQKKFFEVPKISNHACKVPGQCSQCSKVCDSLPLLGQSGLTELSVKCLLAWRWSVQTLAELAECYLFWRQPDCGLSVVCSQRKLQPSTSVVCLDQRWSVYVKLHWGVDGGLFCSHVGSNASLSYIGL